MTDRLTETLAAIELRTVPSGLVALDALVKEAEVVIRFAGDIDPSHFLVVFDGHLADVEAALQRAVEAGAADTLETLLLPRAHDLLRAATGGEFASPGPPSAAEQAVGVVQCHTVLGIIAATDRALKAAEVALLRLRFATDLAGQGHAVLAGEHFDVAVALSAAAADAESGVTVETRIIPRAAPETFAAAAQRTAGPRPLRSLEP